MKGFELFIRRPVATTLISAGLVLGGAAAYFLLPISPLPQVDIPVITVSANLPGASPEVMANSVATPLERRLGSIADLDQIFSQSSIGSSTVTLVFNLDRNIDGAARDVQAAIAAARADLPTALRSNPTYAKVDLSAVPILILTLTSDTMTQGQLYDSASTVISQAISQVTGVGAVNVGGSSLPAVRVELNPAALFHYGIGYENVRAALAAANANSPKGAIEDDERHWQIYSNDQADTAAQYQNLVVAYRNGAPVRLASVADVTDSVENTQNFGIANGKPAVVLYVSRQSGANIIDTVDRVRALLPRLQASVPGAARLDVAMDFSRPIEASLRDAEYSLIIAVILVVLVVYAFIGQGWATLIPGAAVPLSIIGTFAAMALLHYSLNSLSLIALTIATGFVVDDAIVVMENTVRHIEAGVPRAEAAGRGVREVGFTVVSMSLSLIAVFSPILFMGGIAGRFFHEFAAVLSIAILLSMVVSLSTTPVMCVKLLRPGRRAGPDGREGWNRRLFRSLLSTYERSLRWALGRRRLILCVLGGTIVLNFALFAVIRKGFFPLEDTGMLYGNLQAEQSVSPDQLAAKTRRVAEVVQADPAVATVVGTTGGRGGGNSAQLFINLKPKGERKASAEEVMIRLRPRLAAIPGVSFFIRSVQYLGGGEGGQQANSEYQYTLQGDDFASLQSWTVKLVEALKKEPILLDVSSNQQPRGLTTEVDIDRATASRLGLVASQIDSTLYDAFGQRLVSTIYKALNQYHVVMVVQPRFRRFPDILRDVFVSTTGAAVAGTESTGAAAGTFAAGRGAPVNAAAIAADSARNVALNAIAATGKGAASTAAAVSTAQAGMIPLGAFARFETGAAPVAVTHQNLFLTSTVSFNLAPGASLSDAVAAIHRQFDLIHVPSAIRGSFQGNAASFQKIFGNLPVLLLTALATIYVVLGVLYESYAHPFTILSTLPSAGVGALLALLLCRMELSLLAMMGIFLLIGIVKKNAIMMIDLAIVLERSESLPPAEAILRASLLRFRPILMTTMAGLLAALPLVVGFGAGGEFRRPLGVSIAGGLILSQLLTLYTTPVVYLYVERLRRWFGRSRSVKSDNGMVLRGAPSAR